MTPITTNTPQLSVKRKLSKPSLPMYSTTPVVSPSLPPSSSPLPSSSTSVSSLSHRGTPAHVPLPAITLQSPSSTGNVLSLFPLPACVAKVYQIRNKYIYCYNALAPKLTKCLYLPLPGKRVFPLTSKPYNPSCVAQISIAEDTPPSSAHNYRPLSLTWTSCLPLPASTHSLSQLQLPSVRYCRAVLFLEAEY